MSPPVTLGHNASMAPPSLIGRLVPGPVRAHLRRWRTAPTDPRALRVSYRALPGLPDGGYDASDNTHGTHLNESGDIRGLEEYIRTFDPEQELAQASVRDTLGFLHRHVAHRQGAEAHLLDVGCGIGRFASLLRMPGSPTARWRYTGVDRTDDIISACRRLHPADTFLATGNALHLPVPDHTMDVVLASSMLQYTGEAWRTALAEMTRVTRRDVVITRLPLLEQTPSTHCEQTVRYGDRQDLHFLHVLNRQAFESGVAAVGLRVVAREPGTEPMPIEGLMERVTTQAYLLERRELD